MGADETKYSEKITGERRNYNWAVRFDITGNGFVGITQYDGDTVKDRVLLSPDQVAKLSRFVSSAKRA